MVTSVTYSDFERFRLCCVTHGPLPWSLKEFSPERTAIAQENGRLEQENGRLSSCLAAAAKGGDQTALQELLLNLERLRSDKSQVQAPLGS